MTSLKKQKKNIKGSMKKIILDTNVIVSAAIAQGYSRKIVKSILFEEELFEVCITADILDEYERVSTYNRIQKKHPEFKQNILEIIAALNDLSTIYLPQKKFEIIKDLTDNNFLDLAYESHANYLITGNRNDFLITEFEQTKIVSPKKFCELYEQNAL
jgi:putative PIN family toxin of toxin-antitoxin system